MHAYLAVVIPEQRVSQSHASSGAAERSRTAPGQRQRPSVALHWPVSPLSVSPADEVPVFAGGTDQIRK